MDLLYFAFANDPKHPLPHLQAEADAIMRLLSPGELQQRYLIYYDPFATREKISYYLTQYRERLALFHYSGHAGENLLETVDEASHAAGIAHLLGQCPKLQLAFLNGCSTEGQVAGLWQAGVPAIMATSAPVGDEKAANFAKRFYQALSVEDTLNTAFEQAKGELLTQAPEIELGLNRAMNWAGKDAQKEDPTTWGFFVQEGQDAVLNWKLPQRVAPQPIQDFTPNSLLIDSLFEALAPFNRRVRSLQEEEAEGETVDFADKRLAILNSLPAPIAEQLRKLMVPLGDQAKGYDQISLARVQQLVQTYQTTIELFAFTALAQLWEACLASESFSIEEKALAAIRRFFLLSSDERARFPFISLLRSIRSIFDAHSEGYFIEEWADLTARYAEDKPFSRACDYLDALRRHLTQDAIETHLVPESCQQAEQALSEVFQALGFLAKYTLVAVRMIDVVKFRHNSEATFRHSLVRLVKLMGGLEEKQEELDRFMDSRSVLLLKRSPETVDYLNLSPFVIDENAFDTRSTEVSKVFFFAHYDQGQDKCVFRHAYKPNDLPLIVSEQKYPVIKAQFEAFAQLLFHQALSEL